MKLENVTLSFSASGQHLIGGSPYRLSSNTVNYVDAVFVLRDGWNSDDYDAIVAAWRTDYARIITILNANGSCAVPWEVLSKRADVWVNLVGYKSIDGTLRERLTTYPLKAIVVDAVSVVEGTETPTPTPSLFEQFISEVGTYARLSDSNALKAEGYSVGKQNGVSVEDGEYFHNNAKYYYEQSRQDSESALENATIASQKANEAIESSNIATEKASNASVSAQTASNKANDASGYATMASNKADDASRYASNALNSAESAAVSAQIAQSLSQTLYMDNDGLFYITIN